VQQLNGHQKRVRSEIIFVCGYYVLWVMVSLFPEKTNLCVRDISIRTPISSLDQVQKTVRLSAQTFPLSLVKHQRERRFGFLEWS
jgi:predicted metal-binding membrane protein